jgi:hypothetical protein
VSINSIVNLPAVSEIFVQRQVISGHLRVSFRLIIDRKVVSTRAHLHLVESIRKCEGKSLVRFFITTRICPYIMSTCRTATRFPVNNLVFENIILQHMLVMFSRICCTLTEIKNVSIVVYPNIMKALD